jgi:hypothetical protein
MFFPQPLEAVPGEKGGGIVFIVGWSVLLTCLIDVPGAFAPASVASPGAIALKNVCLMFLSLKEYPGFQQSRYSRFQVIFTISRPRKKK